MTGEKGFGYILVIIVIAILIVGFLGGVFYQKMALSNTPETINTPSPSPTATPSYSPVSTLKPTPSLTPTPTQVPTNTADANSPTYIRVTSPNGGENFKVGDTMRVTWSSNNLNKSGSCVVTLNYENGTKSSAWVPVNTPNGSFDWKLTSDSEDKKAKVNMECYDPGQNHYTDESDGYFMVSRL